MAALEPVSLDLTVEHPLFMAGASDFFRTVLSHNKRGDDGAINVDDSGDDQKPAAKNTNDTLASSDQPQVLDELVWVEVLARHESKSPAKPSKATTNSSGSALKTGDQTLAHQIGEVVAHLGELAT